MAMVVEIKIHDTTKSNNLLMSHFPKLQMSPLSDEEDVASSAVMYWMVLVVVNTVSILS